MQRLSRLINHSSKRLHPRIAQSCRMIGLELNTKVFSDASQKRSSRTLLRSIAKRDVLVLLPTAQLVGELVGVVHLPQRLDDAGRVDRHRPGLVLREHEVE